MATRASALAFFGTNELLYLVSSDAAKADSAENLLERAGVISVQVLNEFANAGRRKAKLEWAEIVDILALIRRRLRAVEASEADHERGMAVIHRHALSVNDANIVAAALEAGAGTLYSEDMQPVLRIERALTIVNPFLP